MHRHPLPVVSMGEALESTQVIHISDEVQVRQSKLHKLHDVVVIREYSLVYSDLQMQPILVKVFGSALGSMQVRQESAVVHELHYS